VDIVYSGQPIEEISKDTVKHVTVHPSMTEFPANTGVVFQEFPNLVGIILHDQFEVSGEGFSGSVPAPTARSALMVPFDPDVLQ
jgi:hypothetical protein